MLRLLDDGDACWVAGPPASAQSGGPELWPEPRDLLAVLRLAEVSPDQVATWPGWLVYWRRLGREFLRGALLALRTGRVDLPGPRFWEKLVSERPAHAAWDRLTDASAVRLWGKFDEALEKWTVQHGGDRWAGIRAVAPQLAEGGRVTFHLVENKQSVEQPFAFVGTYSQAQDDGRLVQVPIAKMLRGAAEQENRAAITQVLEPLRQAALRDAFLAELVESQRIFQALAFTPEEALKFLRATPALLEAGLGARIPDWWQGRKGTRPQVLVTVDEEDKDKEGEGESMAGAEDRGKGLEGDSYVKFNVRLALRGEDLTEEEIQIILNSEAPLVSLKGKWVEVDPQRLRAALELWKKAAQAHAQGIPLNIGLRMVAGGLQTASVILPGAAEEEQDTAEWTTVEAGAALAAKLAQFTNGEGAAWPYGSEPPDVTATLRPYQLRGVEWLYAHARMAWGACLADDMGLGKTLQVISLLATRKHERAVGTTLIIAPASLLGNWRQEFRKFAPHLTVFTAHRSQASPREIAELVAGTGTGAAARADVVLTTYGMLVRLESLAERVWDGVILDEAQAIKNAETSQARAARALQGRYRIAMTGTPVENRLDELWSLFAFLNPGLLGSPTEFAAMIRQGEATGAGYAGIRRLVKPFLLRRLKSDPGVAPDLPGKTETTAWCGLTKKQATLYQRAINALKQQLAAAADDPAARATAVLGILLRLKQICNHPSLFSGDSSWEAKDSGKFVRLAELCVGIRDAGERVLVFTQFREMTDVLARELAVYFGRPGLVLHGGTPVGRRAELVAAFQSPSGPPFFVISLRAGGTGLNLTAASHVIHFDRWWNPAVEDQATDRAFRIGQKNHVLVHKFVCQGTLEERIDRILTEKKALADEILAQDGASGSVEQMFLRLGEAELDDLLALQPDLGESE